MAVFQSEASAILRRLSEKSFESAQERDDLLAKLRSVEGLRARDVAWMLFRPDRSFRDAVVEILRRIADPETADHVIAECKGKPEAAVRGAAGTLFALNLPGTAQRLAELATTAKPEIREIVVRLILESPPSPSTDLVLWQMAMAGTLEDRLAAIARLSTSAQADPRILARWQKLAADPERLVRDRALGVLAAHFPTSSVDLFVEQLPLADYSTQQVIVKALTAAAATRGMELLERLLPLVASGDAGTRSAILKILMAMPDHREVVKRFVVFSKTLAGWARDRALESMRAFGDSVLEPAIELLSDPDVDIRASAMQLAQSFEDPRLVPATVALLKDPDWWIRITAAETLGRLKDSRAVPHLVEALKDDDVRWSAVEALGRIGDVRASRALAGLLKDPAPEVRIEVIQALSNFDHPQIVELIGSVARSDDNRAVRSRALELAQAVAARQHSELGDAEAIKKAALSARSDHGEAKINPLLVATRNAGASDLHVSVGQPPILRLAADLVRAQGQAFTAPQISSLVREILSDAQWKRLQDEKQIDLCHYIPNAGRYRANIFVDQQGMNAVFRVIAERPPTIAEIGLPAHLAEIADYHQGLVIVCGPSGSGKSTTLAALVNLFNETRHDHVLTMEDPVEFVHPFKNCLVNQREVGRDTQSFARALRAALREDPDVIVIGELRDNESVSLALTAAETGHIVLGTLNSTSAHKAVDRVLTSFPADEQGQVRASLSESLKYVIAQKLLPAKEARKLVACFEILKNTTAVANMIRDDKTFQLPSAMQIGRTHGMATFDDSLRVLVQTEQVSGETAYRAAAKKEDFESYVSASFLEGKKA